MTEFTSVRYNKDGVSYHTLPNNECFVSFINRPNDSTVMALKNIIVRKYVNFLGGEERLVTRTICGSDPVSELAEFDGPDGVNIIFPDDITVYDTVFQSNMKFTNTTIGTIFFQDFTTFDTTEENQYTYKPLVNNLIVTSRANFGAPVFDSINFNTGPTMTIMQSIRYHFDGQYVLKFSTISPNLGNFIQINNQTLLTEAYLKLKFGSETDIVVEDDDEGFEVISLSKGR